MASNIPPLANAGPDKIVTLPANSTTLTGSGTDSDGTVVAYQWSKVSAPNIQWGDFIFGETPANKNLVSSRLGVVNQRTGVRILNYNIGQTDAETESALNAGYGVVMTISWGHPTDFPTDLTAFELRFRRVMDVYAHRAGMKLFVIENEPLTANFYTQSTTQRQNYLKELARAVSICHEPGYNVKVADGSLNILHYQFIMQGRSGAWNDIWNGFSSLGILGLKQLGLDYCNAHWAAPSSGGSQTVYPANLLRDVSAFVKSQSGKVLTSNEHVIKSNTIANGALMVQSDISEIKKANADNGAFPHIIFYTGQGSPPALPFFNPDLSLNQIGINCRDAIVGTSTGTITSPNSATTNFTGLVQGVYQLQLKVTDNGGLTDTDIVTVTVQPATGNQPPVVNAGGDKVMTLPTNSTTLTGSATDAGGTVVSYHWTKISGPAQSTIVSPNSSTTVINNLSQGTYRFQLAATDNNGAIGTDSVNVTVNGQAGNIPPVANAGTDKTITAPASSVTLTGSGTDADGTITTYLWIKLSGPAGGVITSPNSATTNINQLIPGVYTFRLTVTDNNGATAFDDVTVTVNGTVVNQPPVANAGTDVVMTLPTNSTTLNGTGSSDVDGTITSYLWEHISGGLYTLANDTAASTLVSNLEPGVHIFQLRVEDNSNGSDIDTVQVTVNSANQNPIANAGVDQVITLPTNSVSVSGSGSSDPDGTVVAYLWAYLSGPNGSSITSPNSSNTNITFTQAGVYQYKLTVTDNTGNKDTDIVQITVNSSGGGAHAPVANAGTDFQITTTTLTFNLNGSGSSDVDSNITSYLWQQISGPNSFNIVSPNASVTAVNCNALVAGADRFRLTVTDSTGLSSQDDVLVTTVQDVNYLDFLSFKDQLVSNVRNL